MRFEEIATKAKVMGVQTTGASIHITFCLCKNHRERELDTDQPWPYFSTSLTTTAKSRRSSSTDALKNNSVFLFRRVGYNTNTRVSSRLNIGLHLCISQLTQVFKYPRINQEYIQVLENYQALLW